MAIPALRCGRADLLPTFCYAELSMSSRYQQWMYDWETRLTLVDNNRVVRPMEWGVEWARDWPCHNGFAPGQLPQDGDAEKFLREYNRRIVQSSDEFYSYISPVDFRLERREVQVLSDARIAARSGGQLSRERGRVPIRADDAARGSHRPGRRRLRRSARPIRKTTW